jgi:FKBP-type peptidyl-prolyl cis-trans isomerase FkpA
MLWTNKSTNKARTRRPVSVVLAFVLIGIPLLAVGCGGSEELSSCEDAGVVLESGVEVVDLECGRGALAEPGTSIRVEYEGALTNGEEFDSTDERGPYTFRLDAGQVIDGLDEGLVNMRVGGTRRLTIPPDYAYGNVGLPSLVPANATVVYEVELLSVTESEI